MTISHLMEERLRNVESSLSLREELRDDDLDRWDYREEPLPPVEDPQEYKCETCGAPLMLRGDALGMPDWQVCTIGEHVYCPFCFAEEMEGEK